MNIASPSKKRFRLNGRPILVASHPRSGTHLLIDFIRRQFPGTNIRKPSFAALDRLYLNVERTTSSNRVFDWGDCQSIFDRASHPILKTHYTADFSESWEKSETGTIHKNLFEVINKAAIIYVYRNPMNVMMSYSSFLGEPQNSTSKPDPIAFGAAPHWNNKISRLEWWAHHVKGWRAKPQVLFLRYEDIVGDPAEALIKIEDHIDLKSIRTEPYLPTNNSSIMSGRISRALPGRPNSTAINQKSRVKSLVPDRELFIKALPNHVLSLCNELNYF